MDSLSIKASEAYLNQILPYSEAAAYLIIEVEGNSEPQVEGEYEAIGRLCRENCGLEVFVADNLVTQERIWKARKCVAEALRLLSPVYCMEDITVSIGEIPKIAAEIIGIATRHGVRIPCFGHAKDGNIHATLLRGEMDDARWGRVKEGALEEIYDATCQPGQDRQPARTSVPKALIPVNAGEGTKGPANNPFGRSGR